MLTPRLTNCKDCPKIPHLLKQIDCKLAELANNAYNDIVFMLDNCIPATTITQLLTYRRILMFKYCNPNYLQCFSINDIANKVIRLTVGCVSKCNELKVCKTTTTTTSSSSTTTTTSTSTSSTTTTTSTTTATPTTTTTTTKEATTTTTSTTTVAPTTTTTTSSTLTTTTTATPTTTTTSSSTSTSTTTSSTTTATPTTTTTTTVADCNCWQIINNTEDTLNVDYIDCFDTNLVLPISPDGVSVFICVKGTPILDPGLDSFGPGGSCTQNSDCNV